MSITKSYNKQTGIYYAYETTYEWSDEKQKKVQRKRCVGQFDPETGKVIPNGKVGRPSLPKQNNRQKATAAPSAATRNPSAAHDAGIVARLSGLEAKARALSDEIHELLREMDVPSDPEK